MENGRNGHHASKNGSSIHTAVARLEERLRGYEAHFAEKIADMEERLDKLVPFSRYSILEKIVFWFITSTVGAVGSALLYIVLTGVE